ncbi:putative 4-hydroxy-2-oxoglutarate aldolase, mitochondrial [Talaromyces atroroseus]|uniref:Putative 4-hydroxy-2-oxoglutarate aldolase, mitochondrial n=1 Tax=Talaromyces atroroseus TaxID=1441469 RepID=A0A225AS67_TALAT|nr:putative 4-hydroxy-2-oxoglutarate aldolase, mitochondrial [Talaromyces atroroseus]OKL58439.1 putative 4-hydroxy-2-oxoglutarate aldolase, mitochondrial [Talaromyces atroroseus]
MSPRPLTGGVYVPTVAFFDANEDVDVATVSKHAVFLAQSGVAGIVVQGSNGEAVHLDRAERKLIASTTRQALDSAGYQHIPVIVGTGAQSTRETIVFSKDAAEAGCDYVIALPPSYYKAQDTSASRIKYFQDVADASPIPVLIYNFPGAANGVDLNSDEIIALSQHPNIVGTKLTCANTGKLARIASSVNRSDFFTFGGSCDFTLQTLIAGGQGVIAGTANVIPRASVEVYKLYTAGKVEEAQKLQAIVARADWIAIQGGYPAVKAALQAFYGYGGVPRRPTPAADVAATKARFEESWAVEQSLA